MTKRALLSLGLSALVVGGAIAGQGFAADRHDAKAAAADARAAAKALDRHDGTKAIRFAEEAVAAQPRAAGYRMLLGQGYLQAGRFRSAAAAFADALALDPDNGRAALNLSLAQIATGDWQGARVTLDRHANGIAAADRGLALALAGDPSSAVAVLMEAARAPGATAKVRQNLALALALGGQWQAARTAASADMSPADVDQRMAQWASFAQPRSAAEQVAALLGVQPGVDPGLPVQLSLDAPVMPVTAAPVAVAAAVAPGPMPEAPVAVEVAAIVPPAMAAIVFGPRREVVQPLPVALIRPSAVPARLALARAEITGGVQPIKTRSFAAERAPAGGGWFVQLGAFENAAVARDAWGRVSRRHGIGDRMPNGAIVRTGGESFYRLSVGGFARGDADRLCRRMRVQGGACFVRAGAGDRMAAWANGKTQVASRRSGDAA